MRDRLAKVVDAALEKRHFEKNLKEVLSEEIMKSLGKFSLVYQRSSSLMMSASQTLFSIHLPSLAIFESIMIGYAKKKKYTRNSDGSRLLA